jgi:hypothetical protein
MNIIVNQNGETEMMAPTVMKNSNENYAKLSGNSFKF